VQVWPGSPVEKAVVEEGKVRGVHLANQGVDKNGEPSDGFMPGMEVRAPLTVVADGPVGAVGRQLDEELGMPEGHHAREWALGMKFVVDLPEDCELETGTVIHTLGYPEPEIFGFLYVHPDRVASLGIFVPSWFDNPTRTAYRYLQHWMLHPYLWRHLEGGKLRSWGAKSLQESGRRGEPFLAGDGFARIGEGSGSTNVLLNSGVDEAWATGVQLAEAVIELAKSGKPFDKKNLEAAYVKRRRESWVEEEGRVAEKARDGFQRGVVPGLLGMALTGLFKGKFSIPGPHLRPHERVPTPEEYYKSRIGRIARLPTGRPAPRRQGPGQPRLRRPRHLPPARGMRILRLAHLRGNVLRPGHPTRPRRATVLRPRKMRPLRRLPLELRKGPPGQPGTLPRRLLGGFRRISLGGKLSILAMVN